MMAPEAEWACAFSLPETSEYFSYFSIVEPQLCLWLMAAMASSEAIPSSAAAVALSGWFH